MVARPAEITVVLGDKTNSRHSGVRVNEVWTNWRKSAEARSLNVPLSCFGTRSPPPTGPKTCGTGKSARGTGIQNAENVTKFVSSISPREASEAQSFRATRNQRKR